MVNQFNTMERLRKEREYEDKLIIDLNHFIITELDNISDISEKERQAIKSNLNHIMTESTRHSFVFDSLLQMVLENGEREY